MLFVSLVQATRANTLIAICTGVSAYLAAKASRQKMLLSKRRFALLALALVLAVGSFSIGVDRIRVTTPGRTTSENTNWDRTKSIAAGYLSVFGHWTTGSDGLRSPSLGLGQFTFGGIYEITGLQPREVGVYAASMTLETGEESNIYTAYRGLIQDLSFPGALAMCFLMGMLAGIAYHNLPNGHPFWLMALAGHYAFLIWSPIVSIFNYNGPILALLVGAVVLRNSKTRTRASLAGSEEPASQQVGGILWNKMPDPQRL
jgi:oligosaccharide repeat unit polymerase